MTPFDALRWMNSFARLPDSFHQRVAPTPLPDPYLVAWNPDVGDLLGLPADAGTDPALVAAINGTALPAGAEPLAAIYAGHQFGSWVPQLGDGRAILLGEVETPGHAHWELQLKGAGPTRFSRMSDGRAVLRSTIREYLASEAMHALGVPTTRALAIIGSDAPVYRERTESAAVLVRVAPTHVRFGTFELFASRRLDAEVRLLADYVIEHDYPHLVTLPDAERHAAWYAEVVARTARLMAQWTAVGFAHGVMNTDNFSITGHTIDYGPYGWLDRYDPAHICNHSDHGGRYAFSQQPAIGLWNCTRLGEALHAVVDEAAALSALRGYRAIFETTMTDLLRAKLGLSAADRADAELATDWLALLHDNGADYTRSFRALSRYDTAVPTSIDAFRAEITDSGKLDAWLSEYDARLEREARSSAERHEAMLRTNPKFVLRNWVAQDAIVNAEARNFDRIREVWSVLRKPFDEHPEFEHFAAPPPEWATGLEVSCSS
ncbi:MAG: protein adenylyltransferase SelO [Gemmatimonadales bacterium]